MNWFTASKDEAETASAWAETLINRLASAKENDNAQ